MSIIAVDKKVAIIFITLFWPEIGKLILPPKVTANVSECTKYMNNCDFLNEWSRRQIGNHYFYHLNLAESRQITPTFGHVWDSELMYKED